MNASLIVMGDIGPGQREIELEPLTAPLAPEPVPVAPIPSREPVSPERVPEPVGGHHGRV